MRQFVRYFLLALSIALPVCVLAADRVPKRMRDALRTLASETAKLPAPAAIERYETALAGELKGYGRAHLQVAELYVKQQQWLEAARHFQACDGDNRVDQIDRELVCQGGFNDATAPVSGLPRDGTARVLEPTAFEGPIKNGDRLPRGEARLEVTVDGVPQVARITVDRDARWVAPAQVPAEFVTPTERKPVPDGFIAAVEDPVKPAPVAMRWPAYVAGGVGFLAASTGLALGLTGQSELDTLRDGQGTRAGNQDRDDLDRLEGQAILADGLIFGGAALMAGAVALWFIFDGADPPEDAAASASDEADKASDADEDADADADEDDDADEDADETLDEGEDVSR